MNNELNNELQNYESEFGRTALTGLLESLTVIVKWLIAEGHGSVELHAKDHLVGSNLRCISVVDPKKGKTKK